MKSETTSKKMLLLWLLTLNSVLVESSMVCLSKNRSSKRLHQSIPHTGRPWLVFIKISDGQRMEVCAGSIITQDFVLTAAHCICHAVDCSLGSGNRQMSNNNKIFVEAGISDRRFGFLFPNRTYSIRNVHIHPFYNVSLLYSSHDLALLRLKRRIDFIRGLTSPICIASGTSTLEMNGLSVAGWVRLILCNVEVMKAAI